MRVCRHAGVLRCRHNAIGSDGARGLADALVSGHKRNRRLTELNLWSNDLQDEGARHLQDALPRLALLERLVLVDNGLSAEGGRQLARATSAVIVIDMDMPEQKEDTRRASITARASPKAHASC